MKNGATPTLRVGHQWLESVARSGHPVVNARVMTVKSMAVDLAAPELATRRVTLASARASAMLVDRRYGLSVATRNFSTSSG